ncbi:hypothetical protein C8A00DRAFT_18490 [Chaetomidium leptoderma]|uniref:Uncharacterized protein n=1 Tax=Chaetomidium leptoderma TaxID=669021 RepID=A0AAN6ZTP5_9PEZI|nr:hypothetical protein C8A00DRAFT_18490 [Chaetomidium leptoderma]
MSADLFALFGDLSQTAPPQQNQQSQQSQQNQGASHTFPTTAAPPAGDPFSFLASSTSTLQPQGSRQSTQLSTFQQPTTGQPGSRLTSPVSELQKSNGWGDIGSLGGLGSLQNQTSTFPASQKPVQTEEDDDGWGDFEVAPVNQPRARVTRVPTFDMMTNKLVDLDLEASATEPSQQRPSWEQDAKKEQPQQPARNPDPNVLFDADFEAENGADGGGDDFGDFETGTPAPTIPPNAPAEPAVDLVSISMDTTPAPPKKQPPGLSLSNAALQTNSVSYPEAPKSPYGSFHDRKPEPVKELQVQPPMATKILRTANEASPSPVTAWPAVESDGFGNKWEEFTDLPDTKPAAPKPSSKLKSTTTAAPSSDWDWQDWGATEDQPAPTTAIATATQPPSTTEDKPGPPPTNIPPPAILLSLFPQLLDLASTSLLKPLLTLPPSSPAYRRVLSSQSTLDFLRGYLALATVAARLIAGRKHRWHRDKFLAQGMSISAAPAVGQRGMKLTSVDKAQSAHEDREAAEVVAVWKAQVGRLRGVVAGVNAAAAAAAVHQQAQGGGGGVGLRVPEVAVGLAVTTAKGVPTAPKACVVCGLKRDERLAKVDGEIEDSFGEWWVDFWGHRECRNFWVGHEKELRGR